MEDKATVGRILRDNGYATAWFGKDHNICRQPDGALRPLADRAGL